MFLPEEDRIERVIIYIYSLFGCSAFFTLQFLKSECNCFTMLNQFLLYIIQVSALSLTFLTLLFTLSSGEHQAEFPVPQQLPTQLSIFYTRACVYVALASPFISCLFSRWASPLISCSSLALGPPFISCSPSLRWAHRSSHAPLSLGPPLISAPSLGPHAPAPHLPPLIP